MTTEQEALRIVGLDAINAELRKLVAEREADRAAMRRALEALDYMHTEKCDYMRRNNLGDPLREDAARLAIPTITHLRQRLGQ